MCTVFVNGRRFVRVLTPLEGIKIAQERPRPEEKEEIQIQDDQTDTPIVRGVRNWAGLEQWYDCSGK